MSEANHLRARAKVQALIDSLVNGMHEVAKNEPLESIKPLVEANPLYRDLVELKELLQRWQPTCRVCMPVDQWGKDLVFRDTGEPYPQAELYDFSSIRNIIHHCPDNGYVWQDFEFQFIPSVGDFIWLPGDEWGPETPAVSEVRRVTEDDKNSEDAFHIGSKEMWCGGPVVIYLGF